MSKNTNTYRYRYGETSPVTARINASQYVSIGDLVAVSSNKIYPAQDQTWNTTLAQTQTDFVAAFLGVAEQTKDAGATSAGTGSGGQAGPGLSDDSTGIRVSTTGVFEFDCASANFNVGDLVGPAKDTGNALLGQKVVAVSNKAYAIGRVTEAGTSVTKVKVQIFSTVMGVINN